MRLTVGDSGGILVALSRRNLLALLHKLDMPGSARMLVKGSLIIQVEDDEEHYGERQAGQMHPETEAFIASRGEDRRRQALLRDRSDT